MEKTIFRYLIKTALILLLGMTAHWSNAEYQYRPAQNLNTIYDLGISSDLLPTFETYMKAYQRHVFSNPDSAFLVIDDLKSLKSSDRYQYFLIYLESKALSAQSQYDQAYKSAKQLNEVKVLPALFKADVHLLFGRINKYRNNFAEALKWYMQARKIYIEQEDFVGLSIVDINLAEFYRASTDFDKANFHIHSAIDLIQENDLPELIDVYRINRHSAILSETSKYDSAILLTQQLIPICRRIDNKFLLASGLNELGVLYDFRKKYKRSEDCFLEAISLWKETGHMRYWTASVHHLARYYETIGEQEACISLIREHLPLLKEKKWDEVLSTYYGIMSRAYLSLGDAEKAFQLSDTSHQYLRADLESRITKELSVQEASFEIEKLKNEKERNARQRNFAIIITVIIAGLLFFAGRLAFLIRRRNKKIEVMNNQLTETLTDREVLLQEIHHRVKNNLQVIASLLYLQSDESDNMDVKRILKEGQGRVRSMALIHQKLYENDDLKHIPFSEYLTELIQEIQQSFGGLAKEVQLQIEADHTFFDVDTAVPLGLIINELTTNAFKHAYSKRLGGAVFSVKLKNNNGQYAMTISDNGEGIPEELLHSTKPGSLGLQLTKMLSEQLEGEYSFSNTHGTTFDLKFAV